MINIKDTFRRFVEKHICAPLPPELDDETNYGLTADCVARWTSHHPAYVKHQLDLMEIAGLDTNPLNIAEVLLRYCERERLPRPSDRVLRREQAFASFYAHNPPAPRTNELS
ncbi:MAG: hypothetical protein H6867_06185 [Rhodospirillales bacterium]|nr:hypothetical protein [Rhodospirillales bacterium]MCB9995118.1 hypothetical protein [Rhodospirillales bacterium]